MNNRIVLILFFCLYAQQAKAFWPFTKSYDQLQPSDLVKRLQSEQVDNPNDPQLNYNLGVALYKTNKLDEAKENFKRAYGHATKYPELAQRSIFNAGAMAYKGALASLPKDWEKEDAKVDTKVLEQGLNQAQESVGHFTTLLKDNAQHEPGKAYKALAEELVKKLRKKIEQNKQDDKKDKQDKDEKNDNKDKENQQNGGQDQKPGGDNKGDGDKQKQDKGGDKQPSPGDKDKGQDQRGQQSSDKDQQSQGKDDVDNGQQEGGKDQRQGDGKQSPDKSREQGASGQDEKSDSEKGSNDKQADRGDHESTPQGQQDASGQGQQDAGKSDGTQPDTGMQANEGDQQAVAGQEQEDAKSKALRAMLEHVQSDESKAQKRMMLRKVQQGQQPAGEGQKTW